MVDFAYETSDGRPQDKLVFVFWSPDNSPAMKKMLYAGSKDIIKKQFTGVRVSFVNITKQTFLSAELALFNFAA